MKRFLSVLIAFVVGGALAFTGAYYLKEKGQKESTKPSRVMAPTTSSLQKPVPSQIEEELNALAAKMLVDWKSESRLTLNMVAQLRSYEDMLEEVMGYSQRVEKDLAIFDEISKHKFQEDVALQADLFSGKKSEVVAKHLQQFQANRVGAILARMRPREASTIMDHWAVADDQRVSKFYREVMASYLNNKRFDENPEFFTKQLAKATHDDNAPAKPAARSAGQPTK
ncbi:hypothetical protein JYU14_01625 [Simkania negevensis]|uniref:Uncharacterized protein n=1 Tax=Simkania negevensis TaxID=83561 RepID=A0ABS3AR41_9BACT|nr:hypothetical protein [Simkania negevensis]